MTGSTLFLLALVGGRTSLSDRLRVQAAGGLTDLGTVTVVVRRVLIFTVLCEAVGAIVLTIVFLARGEHPVTATWWGIFHSISAFNNGGIDLFGGFRGLTHLADAPAVLVPIGALMLIGGLGFAIVGDIVREAALDPPRARDEARRHGDPRSCWSAARSRRPPSNGRTRRRSAGSIQRTGSSTPRSIRSRLRSGGMDAIGVGGLVDESLVARHGCSCSSVARPARRPAGSR